MRIGIGIDFHRFAINRKLILGGVEIPHERGLAGHSDADVLLHAICDALLGAAALGDIGQHFPDSDPRYKNISSLLLLAETKQKIASAGFQIENLDATIIAERPKLAPYIAEMRSKIAEALGIGVSQINIKATTAEGMGAIGRAEGIAVWATALLSAQRAS
ncbi:MAG: 2-C-methyl-D-erythritol 2,4-cyclodiphosphate synthase [Candidatus Bipolaricaulota bacterium]|nr:2-C-methyl-D-erythritol 2,4-cyclodiphosphate synthase [Candidatus Bipolaricaulota bacterium]MCS7274157.1 2-C-methyl-D-erythritol 2,4-cyclodiphosphate synthase [Candidatus Bipolaricaulota bacterium]MDW8111430.1 2-C-methyl-D-erythritol 2,4-cyclodiphosphate synthase [Candidatus Bipolaricaulota bacterium]MDW8329903.1 2-C-methyl-D-erythritol 2,4-cyclodiphosphate synthase [Candidatus Bipolaricaulota bacterium]